MQALNSPIITLGPEADLGDIEPSPTYLVVTMQALGALVIRSARSGVSGHSQGPVAPSSARKEEFWLQCDDWAW
jgi:hypothetical protein